MQILRASKSMFSESSTCLLTRCAVAMTLLAIVGCADGSRANSAHGHSPPIAQVLRGVAAIAPGPTLVAIAAIESFYSAREYRGAWSRTQAESLLAELNDAPSHGLDPSRYHSAKIAEALAESRGEPGPELDVLLSDAFLAYASHLAFGRVDPKTLERDWRMTEREIDLVATLERVTAGDSVPTVLNGLLPQAAEYAALEAALARYRDMSWDSPMLASKKLERGTRGEAVRRLTERLAAEGYMSEVTDLFSRDVDVAVRQFQRSRGISETGIVSKKTREALDVQPEQLISAIELNLERWRWMSRDLGEPHVLVNAPAFSLRVVERGKTVLRSKIIVGKRFRRTPVFSGAIESVVINPSWHVPRRIALADKLPLIKKDPGYLRRNHYTLLEDGEVVDPKTVDWNAISKKSFPYRLRQSPGKHNALGRIKFNIENDFNVYLHDTNEPELFAKPNRTFSSGCIRIAKARELASFVLGAPWSLATLEEAIEGGKTRRVDASRPVMVHLQYFTAWVDEGTLSFRTDIYRRDKRLAAALSKQP